MGGDRFAVDHILSKRDGLAHHFARILRCGTDKRRAAALKFFNRFRATVDAGNFDRARFARLFNGQYRTERGRICLLYTSPSPRD